MSNFFICKPQSYLLGLLCCSLLTVSAWAKNEPLPAPESTSPPAQTVASGTSGQEAARSRLVPAAPKVDAKSHVLLDVYSGKIITENNAHERMPPASLTKMMTMYVVSQALKSGQIKLDDPVRVSNKAWKAEGSRMFIKEGQIVPVKDLIMGVVVDSGNDACIALAEFIAGSEDSFASLMNQEAAKLGMQNSHFMDSTGMPNPDHYTSAYDMALLSSALITHFPDYYPWYSQKWFNYGGIKQPNRNRLLWRYEYADGIKTGHTDEAGYCLAASAKYDGMRLVSVVLGAPNDRVRSDASQSLLTYGFRFYKTYKLYKPGEPIAEPRIWKGTEKHLPLGVAQDFIITLPRGRYNDVKLITALNEPIVAPVQKGQQIGTLTVNLGDTVIGSTPLIALAEVPEGGLWSQFTDSINQKVHELMSDATDGKS